MLVGNTWRGTLTAPGNSPSATISRTVVAVDEAFQLSGKSINSDRLNLTANGLHGREWIRTSDRAVLRIEWDSSTSGMQPVPAGTVTIYDPPCATQWPLQTGAAWTSSCTVTSWPSSDTSQRITGTESVHATVSADDTGMVLHEDGTVTYADRPDATYHFSRDSTFPSQGCAPGHVLQTDNTGTSQILDAAC